MKKDKMFILISALVAAGISYQLIKTLVIMVEEHNLRCVACWGFVAVDIIALVAVLWLLQNYKRRRRIKIEKAKRKEKPEPLG